MKRVQKPSCARLLFFCLHDIDRSLPAFTQSFELSVVLVINGVLAHSSFKSDHYPFPSKNTSSKKQLMTDRQFEQGCLDADTPGPSQVNKTVSGPDLDAPVQRIFYLRHEGRQDHEVFPDPNPALLTELEGCDAVLYGMGSLYTSICPSLILEVASHPYPAPVPIPHPICCHSFPQPLHPYT